MSRDVGTLRQVAFISMLQVLLWKHSYVAEGHIFKGIAECTSLCEKFGSEPVVVDGNAID